MKKVDISIIIATRDREKILWESVAKALIAIENKNVELLIINDGEQLLNIPAAFGEKIICFNNPKKGVSSARNFGSRQANGSILFFIDDDMWINEDAINWITSYVIEKENDKSVYIINWSYPAQLNHALRKSKVGRYITAANYNNLWGRMNQKTEQPASGLFKYHKIGSGSLVISKDIFDLVGKYDENIVFAGEDEDLANKINNLHVPIYVIFDVILEHNHADRLEIHAFLKRIYDGFGSEFQSEKAAVTQTVKLNYAGLKLLMFDFFRRTEQGWILLHQVLPNLSIMQPLYNKLIGGLGGLQRYKQWKQILRK
jgi:glycosyltransferase involved in cell wall biosynthesis